MAYNRLVTIKAPPTAQDALGQPTGAWTTVATSWANVRYLSGSESIKAGADTASAKASIRLRSYRSDITAAMRVELGATVFQINVVMPDEDGRQFTDLACEVIQ